MKTYEVTIQTSASKIEKIYIGAISEFRAINRARMSGMVIKVEEIK